MDWRIPEKLKKRVSYAQFTTIVQVRRWQSCSILDSIEKKFSKPQRFEPHRRLEGLERVTHHPSLTRRAGLEWF
jgi:hypothetical protein